MDRFSIFFKLTSNFPTSELNDIADILGKIFFKRFSRDFKIISTIGNDRASFFFFRRLNLKGTYGLFTGQLKIISKRLRKENGSIR